MGRLLNIIGLNAPQYKFSDFEPNLRMHYLANFGIDVVFLICGIIFGLTSKYLTATLVFLGMVLILCLFHTYGILQLLGGQVIMFEGECSESDKQMVTVLKKQFFGKSNISVVYNDKTYLVPVRHNSPFKEGVKVRVYLTENGLYQKDEDTFTIPYPIYVSKIKNVQHKEK